jgi:cell filamentation protein, protein adenylyltransferase
MHELLISIAAKKRRLDELRPLSPKALTDLEHYYDIELTYTSNAIEGNTLNAVKTTLVIEKGVTISGKPLKDHLEALDHYDAIRYVRELARQQARLTESDVRNLHKLVIQRSASEMTGQYADLPRYVRTEKGATQFPVTRGDSGFDGGSWLLSCHRTRHAGYSVHNTPWPCRYPSFQ